VGRVLGASLLGRMPLGAAPLALLVFARDSMTITVAGLLVGAYTAGVAVGGPLLSRAADRWRQVPVLWAAVGVSTLGYVVTATGPPLPLALLSVVVAGLGAPPFEACLRVLWRTLLPEAMVHTAYSLDIAVQELIFIVGPLVTLGAVALAGHPATGLLAAAALQLAGTAWFTAAPAARSWRGVAAPTHWAGPLRAADLRLILVAVVLVGAGVGSFPVAATRYAEVAGARSWAGWLLAAQATGALAGGLLYPALKIRTRARHLPWLAGALALGYLPLLVVPGPLVMLPLVAMSGLALPPLLTAVFGTVDRVAPPGTAAEAFAWVATAFSVGAALGSAVDGVLLDRTGSVTAGFALAPVVILLAALTLRLGRPAQRGPSGEA
jgi:predicted MFS family arabinose efflux permease